MKTWHQARTAATIAILAGILGVAAPARAAVTQPSENVNNFLFGSSYWSFSVSKVSTLGVESKAITVPTAISTSSLTVSNQTGSGGGVAAFQGSSATQSIGGSKTGDGVSRAGTTATAAPISGSGATADGNYLYVSNGASTTQGQVTTRFGSYGTGYLYVKSFEVLWGSVEASNSFGLYNAPDYSYVTGSDILAAASILGISGGNAGSYYVTFNAIGSAASFQTVAKTGAGTAFEWIPTSYSLAGPVTVAMPASIQVPVGAPAPVVGSTPAGGLLAIGLLGFLGLGRRRVSHGARAAA